MTIYNFERKLKTGLENLARSTITNKNKELIKKFLNELVIEGISIGRQQKYLGSLKKIGTLLNKDFDKATIDDVKRVVAIIQQSNYTAWTRHGYQIIIRRFYRWLMGDPNDTIYPEIVRWIKPKVKRSERRLPSDGELLTEEDAQKLMEAAEHPRNKAFVATLWESGARVGEIGSLKVKNVTFDKHGTVITVMGKTGSRKIRLVLSTPYLSTWLNNHALTTEPDAPLWTNLGPIRKHKAMSYSNIRKILQTVAKKAGLKKRCNPHLFRHSRATMLANHLTEFQMNQYFGWIQGSDMPSTYVHMSGREADKAILAMNGIETQEAKQQTTLQPIICPRCETINTPDAKHCNKCAGIVNLKHALDIEVEEMKQKTVRKEADDMMDLLMRDKEVQALLSEKISQLGGIKNRHTE